MSSTTFQPTNTPKQVQIAIVGMTGAGKTVLISTLAMKMSQMADKGVFLAPVGDNRRQTLKYVQQNWATLNNGQWPSSTPAGELIHLQWELSTFKNIATVRFADCAGQDIRYLFSQDRFNVSNLPQDYQDLYRYFQRANIILFLVNMEDILGFSPTTATDNVLNLDQMITVLTQPTNIPRRCAVVLSQYDKYKPEVDSKYHGDLMEYLRINLPLLHGQYVLKKSFEIIPVAAVEQTQNIIENGQVKKVPAPDFTSYNLQTLISWIADNVDLLTPLLPAEQYSPPRSNPPARPTPTGPKTLNEPTATAANTKKSSCSGGCCSLLFWLFIIICLIISVSGN